MFFIMLCSTATVYSQNPWEIEGNTLNYPIKDHFLGSINNMPVRFKTNNIERMRLTETGFFGIGTETPTQLLDVDGQIRLRFGAANYKVLSSDTDGNSTWEFLQLDLSGNSLSVLNHGNAIDLSAYLDNTDAQTLSLIGTTLSISNANNVLFTGWDTDASNDFSGNYNDLSNLPTLFDGNYNSLSNLPTLFDSNWSSLTGTAPNVSVFNNDAGYLTFFTEIDGDITNEIQDLQLDGNILTITDNGTATEIDLELYLDNTDTQLTESEVDAFADNNGYLTSFTEIDGDITNEIQDLQVVDNQLSLTDSDVSLGLNELNYWSKLDDNLFYNTANIGIGINEPQKLLHIHSDDTFIPGGGLSPGHRPTRKSGSFNNPVPVSSTSSMLFTNVNSGSTASDGLIIKSYNNNAIIYLQETGSLTLQTKNNLRFKMQQNGNVSIGDLNTNFFTVKENGNIGIGTDEPVADFHIKGNKMLIEQNGNRLYFDADNGGVEIGSNTNQIAFWYAGNYNKIKAGDVIAMGNVGIGTDNPQYMLDVRGNAHFCKVEVKTQTWCDYVFADDYQLPDLQELEKFVKQNRHLPGVPSEAEVLKNGIDLGAMNIILLEKVEELTLIIIEQNKRLIKLEEANKN